MKKKLIKFGSILIIMTLSTPALSDSKAIGKLILSAGGFVACAVVEESIKSNDWSARKNTFLLASKISIDSIHHYWPNSSEKMPNGQNFNNMMFIKLGKEFNNKYKALNFSKSANCDQLYSMANIVSSASKYFSNIPSK